MDEATGMERAVTDSERQRFEIILERIEHNVSVIAEGHGALIDRLDRLEVKLARIEEQVGDLIVGQQMLSDKVDAIGQRLDGHETRIAQLEQAS